MEGFESSQSWEAWKGASGADPVVSGEVPAVRVVDQRKPMIVGRTIMTASATETVGTIVPYGGSEGAADRPRVVTPVPETFRTHMA